VRCPIDLSHTAFRNKAVDVVFSDSCGQPGHSSASKPLHESCLCGAASVPGLKLDRR
jgi:hypothetical protein